MMSRRSVRWLSAVSLVLASTAAGASEPPSLSHNPFTRPPSERTIIDRPAVSGASFDDAQALVLQAAMVTGNAGFATVDGRVLRPGDEIYGYTLLRVFEDRAVFVRNGERLTVYVKPEREDDDG